MLDGDQLYAEIFENKDPLFFYTYAGALWVGGWRGPFLLDAIWVGLAGVCRAAPPSSGLLARRSSRASSCTPSPWRAGGTSWASPCSGRSRLVLFAPWLWLRGRFAASGAAPSRS